VNLEAELKRHFGFDAFRAGQREACGAALAGRDVLVVMPTGSGKSLCYQLPALLRDDLTIVVSPLVALMKDQVDALRARVGDRVRVISGQHSASANADALNAAVRGEARLLYVAPERFSSPGFARRIAQARIGLFVVDEAHCVSQWGHDFRPDYFRLADVARELGAEAIVASTATATPRVASDIVRRLGLRDPLRVATGFDRPNLSFVVAQPGPSEKYRLLVAALSELPAIVYAGTRAASEQLADALSTDLGVAIGGADAVLGGVLGGLDVNAVRRTRCRAEEARHALLEAILVAPQDVDASVAVLEMDRVVRVILGDRRPQQILEGDAESFGQRRR